jgi:hypothetical protein
VTENFSASDLNFAIISLTFWLKLTLTLSVLGIDFSWMKDRKFGSFLCTTNAVESRVARLILMQCTKTEKNIPNDHKIYQMAVKHTKTPRYRPTGHKMYQHLPVQDPPKFTQIRIFGLKIYHLATLVESRSRSYDRELQRQRCKKFTTPRVA